ARRNRGLLAPRSRLRRGSAGPSAHAARPRRGRRPARGRRPPWRGSRLAQLEARRSRVREGHPRGALRGLGRRMRGCMRRQGGGAGAGGGGGGGRTGFPLFAPTPMGCGFFRMAFPHAVTASELPALEGDLTACPSADVYTLLSTLGLSGRLQFVRALDSQQE